jgi:hypothetical protein
MSHSTYFLCIHLCNVLCSLRTHARRRARPTCAFSSWPRMRTARPRRTARASSPGSPTLPRESVCGGPAVLSLLVALGSRGCMFCSSMLMLMHAGTFVKRRACSATCGMRHSCTIVVVHLACLNQSLLTHAAMPSLVAGTRLTAHTSTRPPSASITGFTLLGAKLSTLLSARLFSCLAALLIPLCDPSFA